MTNEEINKWKHNTKHRRYECDKGTLVLIIGGTKISLENGVGDGSFPIYLLKDANGLPETFKRIPFYITTNEKIGVLDYDCCEKHILYEFRIKGYLDVYRDDFGAFALVGDYEKVETVYFHDEKDYD